MYAVIAVNTLLVFAAVAKAQHCWCIESASSGATPFVGQTEDKLVSGPPWEAGAGDVRSAWLAHSAGHGDNRVLAAVFDGSQSPQTVVFEEGDDWSDPVNGGLWSVNYDVHYLGVNASDLNNLRVTTQFLYNNVVRLTLNHAGSSVSGQVRFVAAPQHSWAENPVETGSLWTIRVTLRRTAVGTGQPAMIWVDNHRVREGGITYYDEPFYIKGDMTFDNLINGNDMSKFIATVLNPGGATDHEICAADLNLDMSATDLDIPLFVDRLLDVPPTGACCFVGGSCLEDTLSGCNNAGGSYQGDGASCGGCPVPDGACCLSFGCLVLSENVCDLNGGTFQGGGTTCVPDPCP